MKKGFYAVEFWTSEQMAGAGIIVMENGRISGGDTSFGYDGKYREEDGGLSVSISIFRHSEYLQNALNLGDEMDLKLKGSNDEDAFDISGPVIGQLETIRAKGKWVRDIPPLLV